MICERSLWNTRIVAKRGMDTKIYEAEGARNFGFGSERYRAVGSSTG